MWAKLDGCPEKCKNNVMNWLTHENDAVNYTVSSATGRARTEVNVTRCNKPAWESDPSPPCHLGHHSAHWSSVGRPESLLAVPPSHSVWPQNPGTVDTQGGIIRCMATQTFHFLSQPKYFTFSVNWNHRTVVIISKTFVKSVESHRNDVNAMYITVPHGLAAITKCFSCWQNITFLA